ncbi:D-alanyl-D-alanine carboxypeptidase [Microaerobacter geothermalis]|uniref:D-alanyl-D-alanine carboxypeptidase family protein n=1 Tax=Microaerobacter geothermalis TaxID=674972 RepID=UPI001F405CF6|nr:D-alanyl-D-alanine carboxypeptidase family protein [Microaerobacter geothermalis]MCF6093471.1 D-alanyl-D-alanine carboxypeptidase [Microaerobacter geothermalis]
MRKWKVVFIALALTILWPTIGLADEKSVNLAPEAISAILIDSDTGTILYEKNGNQKLPPASITKIMTMLLVVEAIDNGKISLSDKVRASEYAASMGGSQIFLEPGEEMSVEDLLKGVAVASGNDASIALAEYIAGTEEAFVQQMNEKAKQLGMNNTHFSNSNGLPAENHYTTAYDISIMSRELLKYEDLITKYTGIYQDYLRKDTNRPFWLVNTNRLVRFYPGVDGLKTGYTSEAKFCLAATAKRDSLRVIAVVMGEPNSKVRNKEVAQMLDFAFSQYKNVSLYTKGQVVQSVAVDKGKEEKVNVIVPRNFSILLKKGEKEEAYQQEIQIEENIPAPIDKGRIVGKIVVKKDGREISSIDLVAEKQINKASTWELITRTAKRMFLQ